MAILTADETTAINSIVATVGTKNYDYQIRRALMEAVALAAPTASTHIREKVIFNATDNTVALMASAADADRIHGWMVTRRVGEQGEQRGPANPPAPAMVRRENVYAVVGVHYYGFGDDATNTEDAFGLECDKVVAAIDALGSIAGASRTPLRYTMGLIPNAGKLVHLFTGFLSFTFDYCG